jgi:NlpC/P60 family putative phage cell wall peptidase
MTTDDLPADAARAAAIIAAARGWIGTPYRHQASLKGVGCDCLGLLRGVWREVIGPEPETVPPYARTWAETGGGEAMATALGRHLVAVPIAAALPGAVLLFRFRRDLPAKHAGILATPTSFIHAYAGAAVAESPLLPWWRRRIAYAFTLPPV